MTPYRVHIRDLNSPSHGGGGARRAVACPRRPWPMVMLVLALFCLGANTVAARELPPPDQRRIISLSPSITELIYLLGAQDRIMANTLYCNVPQAAQDKEKVGTMTQANVEKIIYLQPDLVIASPLSSKKQIKLLESQGIRVILKENPQSFEAMCRLTLDMGAVMGREKEARDIVVQARTSVALTAGLTQGLPKKRVFIQIGIKPLKTVNKEMFINEYIQLAGGTNIAEDEPSWVYSRENVIRANPDIILIATMGSAKKVRKEEQQRWLAFSALKASKEKTVYILDPDVICSPTPISFARGLAVVAALIHPRALGVQ